MNKCIAVYPGSFDPITEGHFDIIKRSARLFEHITVLVVINPEKKTSFTPEERIQMIAEVVKDIPNVSVDRYEGLLVDYVKKNDIKVIVRGLRAVTDFEYEFQMALTNRKMYEDAETLFLTTTTNNMFLSSSMVKQLAYFGADIHDFVSPKIHDRIVERLKRKDE